MAYSISRWRKGFKRINTRYLRQVATQITQMVEFGCHRKKKPSIGNVISVSFGCQGLDWEAKQTFKRFGFHSMLRDRG